MNTYRLYRTLTSLGPVEPAGRWVFSQVYAQAAPYFRTVRPQVVSVEPNRAAVRIQKRRRVQNHIGTVHAIAVCNGLEAAMGLCAEATVPKGRRWIPKGMDVNYLAKSTTDLVCTATTDPADWARGGDVPCHVEATREDGTVVVSGTIRLWVSDAR